MKTGKKNFIFATITPNYWVTSVNIIKNKHATTEGDIDPSDNIPPDKSVNNGVTADNVSTDSKPNKLTCNAGNTNIAIESEPEAYNVETELN